MTGDISGNGKLLARIDERTQRMDEKMDSHHAELCKRLDDHEDRIRDLEGSRNWSIGRDLVALVGAAVAGIVGAKT